MITKLMEKNTIGSVFFMLSRSIWTLATLKL